MGVCASSCCHAPSLLATDHHPLLCLLPGAALLFLLVPRLSLLLSLSMVFLNIFCDCFRSSFFPPSFFCPWFEQKQRITLSSHTHRGPYRSANEPTDQHTTYNTQDNTSNAQEAISNTQGTASHKQHSRAECDRTCTEVRACRQERTACPHPLRLALRRQHRHGQVACTQEARPRRAHPSAVDKGPRPSPRAPVGVTCVRPRGPRMERAGRRARATGGKGGAPTGTQGGGDESDDDDEYDNG